MFSDIAYAMGNIPGGQAVAEAGGPMATFMQFIPLVLIVVIFYFLLIRPQQKKAKEHKLMMEGLKKGDKVITQGGIYGVVEAVGTNTLTLKIAENVKVKFGKGFVATVRASAEED